MKVKDLHPGMLLIPESGGLFVTTFKQKLVCVVDEKTYKESRPRQPTHFSVERAGTHAVYMGQRKDLNLKKEEISDWSNRYVLIEGNICAVDSSAWHKIIPAV